jgi:GntR family transcriptional repressor for pyruvate dehydrogenase complex
LDTTETARFVTALRSRILAGELPDGSRLEPERELAQRHGLSRTTIRAGLQALEASGLISRRVGRAGGSFVSMPTEEAVASSLRLVVGAGGISGPDLMETRLAIEPMCAELAADRMGEGGLVELSDIQSEMVSSMRGVGNPVDRKRFLAANAQFHLRIAHGSGNAALAAILSGLIDPIEELTDDPETLGEMQLRELIRAHEVILSALQDRNGPRAGEAMRKHLRAHLALTGVS